MTRKYIVMSFYKAPDRLSGNFNANLHPKKVLAIDHFHGATGGEVKQVADNAFTGINTFSNETSFTPQCSSLIL